MASRYGTKNSEFTRNTLRRGNFYFGLAFALLGGLGVVVALGLLGVPSLGIFTLTTAWAMTGIAITLLAAVSAVTLFTMRRTLHLLARHDQVMEYQAARHAFLERKVRHQWMTDQLRRDNVQDHEIAVLTARRPPRPAPAPEAARVEPEPQQRQRVPADPFDGGQIYPVQEVEGIGERRKEALGKLGLKDTRDLWRADARHISAVIGADTAEVKAWQSMAELMAVTGIGKQYAELLVRADVSNIGELAKASPEALMARIEHLRATEGSRIQGNAIGMKNVYSWIHAAQWHEERLEAMAFSA